MRSLAHLALGISSAAALLAGCAEPKALTAVPAEMLTQALPQQRTFHYTGRKQRFTEPSSVHQITVVALRAGGAGEFTTVIAAVAAVASSR